MFKRGIGLIELGGIILALAGLVMLGAIFYNIYGSSDDLNQRDLCHLSVLERGSLDKVAEAGSLVPLQCSTNKICVTDSKSNKCKQFTGEDSDSFVIDTGDKEESIERIEELTANAMFDCWSMLGEGKVDLFNDPSENLGVFEVKKSSCVVCSRIAISESLLADEDARKNIIEKVDVDDYLINHNVPGSARTYIETFTDSNLRSYPALEEGMEFNSSIDDEVSSQLAVVFMQIKAKDPKDAAIATAGAGVVFVGGLALSPLGKFVPKIPAAIVSALVIGGTAGFSAYKAYEGGRVSAGYCGEFLGSGEGKSARAGCSLTKTMAWDVNSINNLCGKIEGEL